MIGGLFIHKKGNNMIKRIAIFCCAAVLLTSCPEDNDYQGANLVIINQSDEVIFWIKTWENTDEWYEIPSIDSYLGENYDEYIILKRGSYKRYITQGEKNSLKRGWHKYTLFNYDSLRTISWERICEERIILKEVIFNSWEQMEACDFTITYP